MKLQRAAFVLVGMILLFAGSSSAQQVKTGSSAVLRYASQYR